MTNVYFICSLYRPDLKSVTSTVHHGMVKSCQQTCLLIPMDWYSLPLSVRKLFFATGDHYRKPQSIKMQIRGIQSQWVYICLYQRHRQHCRRGNSMVWLKAVNKHGCHVFRSSNPLLCYFVM